MPSTGKLDGPGLEVRRKTSRLIEGPKSAVATPGPPGPALGLLRSQQAVGNRETVRLLAAGRTDADAAAARDPRAGLRVVSAPRIQRLVDRPGLEAKAGRAKGNVGLKKMSVQYKTILAKLDAYHAKSDQLWGGKVTGVAYADALNPLLDDLATETWAYISDREESARAPHLRELVSVEIPAERRRLRAAARRSDFTEIDRAAPVADVGVGRAARVAGAGVDVGYATVADQAEGGMAQCHSMALWVDVDAGDRPSRQPNDAPDSVYGVTLEYWEEVKVDYNFVEKDTKKAGRLKRAKEGASHKQWNDIKMHTPDSPTFTKVGGQIELSWPDAVRQSATLQLRGRKKVGFADNPGVTPIEGKHIRRTLNFRIVVKDGANRQEIFATQIIECDGDKDLPASMTYVDSVGNALGRTRPSKGAAQMVDMADDDDRLENGPAVGAGDASRAVSARVRTHIQPFVRELMTHTAPAFRNSELEAVQAKFPTAGDLSGPYKAYSKFGEKKYNTASDYYEIAGMNSAPYPQPGFSYFEHVVRGDERMMAMMRGDQLIRMYYTNGKKRAVGAQQVSVRSFGEIPIEEATAYVETERKLSGTTGAERLGYDAAVAVRSNKVDQLETAIDNAVLLSKQDRGTAVRLLLEQNPRDYERIEKYYDQNAGGDTLGAMLTRWYRFQMKNKNLDAALFERLGKRFPNHRGRALLAEAWQAAIQEAGPTRDPDSVAKDVALVMTDARKAVGAAPGLDAVVRNVNGAQGSLKARIMAYAESHKMEQPTLEKVYNATVPALGVAGAPATIGPLISEYFTEQFQAAGDLRKFSSMMDKYPGLEYRIRPAYRQVHGDKALQTVSDRYRAVDAAVDVPNPGGSANLKAKADFMAHGLFTQDNFASSIEKRAQFDTAYDPVTGVLKVTVKLFFDFQDNTNDVPVKIKGKEVGRQYANKQWSDQAKTKYKDDFRAAVRDTWSANAPLIRCTRPGWEDIVARPTFQIAEATTAKDAHNPIIVRKSIFADDGAGGKKISGGRSGWGGNQTILNEADVSEKISDPAVHRYLHMPERKQNIEPAFLFDNKQLVRRLQDYGALKFTAGTTTLVQANRVDMLAGEITRLLMAPELAALHALEVVAPTLAGTDGQRVNAVASQLATKGVANPIAKVADGTVAADTVVVRAAPPDPAVKDVYVNKWSRITAAHEFGHMLGLMDEYYGAKSGEVVKKMISDGLLPTDTRADHLVANPPTANEDEGTGQEATASLLERAQLSGADVTLADGARSSSLMTAGYELWPQHYVTVWEALTRMTRAELGERFWKLG